MEQLIEKLRKNKIDVAVEAGNLKLGIPNGFDAAEIIHKVREHKQELISFIQQRTKSTEFSNITACPKQAHYAMSSAQKRLFFLQEMDKASTAYNILQLVHFDEELDKERIEEVFNQLIARHESLRTTFVIIDGEPRQVIAESLKLTLTEVETTTEQFMSVIDELSQAFDLGEGPLLRVGLIRSTDPDNPECVERVLAVEMHHIIADGISLDILTQDIMSLYKGEKLQALHLQYKDFAEWQQSEEHQKQIAAQKAFWHHQLAGEIPVSELPTDYPRSFDESYEGGLYGFEIGPESTFHLRRIAREQGVTLYTILLTLCNIWLHKLTGQQDIIVGSPIAGRNHIDLQSVIGIFINVLALRNYPAADKSFISFLQEVNQQTLQAFDNQDYQFEDLVKSLDVSRDITRNPLFDVFLNLHGSSAKGEDHQNLGSPQGVLNELENDTNKAPSSKFDLTIYAGDQGDTLGFSILYKKKLFTPETIAQFAQYFINITASIAESPTQTIEEISILNSAEKNIYLEKASKNLSIDQELPSLQQRLSDSFTQHKNLAAISYKGQEYTYKDLDDRTNAFAEIFLEKSIVSRSYIGILCEDRYALIAAILATLKNRCIFVPLSPALPDKKLQSLIQHLDIQHVFTDIDADRLDRIAEKSQEIHWYQTDDYHTAKIDFAQYLKNSLSDKSYELDDPIYVYFTSGSTGKPKGIIGRNKGLSHFVDWEISTFSIDSSFRISQLIPPGFDPFLRDLFVTLCAGATLCIPPDETAYMLHELREWIEESQVHLIHTVPSVFRSISSSNLSGDSFSHLKYVLLSGEAISPAELKNWYQILGKRIGLFNLYGPTEATLIKSYYPIQKSDTSKTRLPIGKSIPQAQLLILDEKMKMCGPLITGEIYIRTPYLSLGYTDPSLNKGRFIPNPFSDNPHDLFYKTGDEGRLLMDGNIEFLGRKDDQVKIRGNRVELSEISTCLQQFGNILKSVAVIQKDSNDTAIVCAYFVAKEEIDLSQLRNYLASELPIYMVPAFLCQIDSIPYNSNGKINRKALPKPALQSQTKFVPPTSAEEKLLADIWAEVLGLEEVGITDNFFSIGGDSIKSMQIVARLKQKGYKVSIRDMFKAQTIESLTSYMQVQEEMDLPHPILAVEKRPWYPMSSAQKRLFLMQKMEKSSLALNMYSEMEIGKEYDLDRLHQIFNTIIQRHESLRTSFAFEGNTPIQIVHEKVDFQIDVIPLSEYEAPYFSYKQPFDLEKAPLLRVGWVEKEKENLLLIDINHMVSDGISNIVLQEEFTQIAQGQKLPELPLQYKDYAVWQQQEMEGGLLKQQQAYWLEVFSGQLPRLSLPIDKPQGDYLSNEGSSIAFYLQSSLSAKLKQFAQTHEVSLFSLMLAIQTVVLHKLSGQEDIIIGFPSTGRNNMDLEKIIGVFINTIALRMFPEKDKGFDHFLIEVSDHITVALDNQDYQFDELIERLDVSREKTRNPLFRAIMVMQNHMNLQDLTIDTDSDTDILHESTKGTTVNDLFIRCAETRDHLLLNIQYSTALFTRDSVIRIFQYFKEVAEAILEHEQIKLKDIALSYVLEEAEIKVLDDNFNF